MTATCHARYRRKILGALALVGALLALELPAAAGAHQELMANTFIGAFRVFAAGQKSVLAYTNGRTMYTFERDEPGKTSCLAACAEAWPPALAGPGDTAFTDFTIIVRPDGARQWAYRDKPLYLSARDTANGQANGDGLDNVWSVIEIDAHEM